MSIVAAAGGGQSTDDASGSSQGQRMKGFFISRNKADRESIYSLGPGIRPVKRGFKELAP